jgi:hypothetical protein
MTTTRIIRHVALPAACIAGTLLAIGQLHADQDKQRAKATRAPAAAAKADKAELSAPLDKLGTVLDGFHYRDGAPGQQMEAIHYCAEVDADLIQCVLYDSVEPTARLIGVEYVITEKALAAMPEAERALWHSHGYEVASGMLHAPALGEAEEHALMAKIAGTYGKTWHTWQTDAGDAMPLGRADLLMAFTKKGQARADLTKQRDERFGLNTDDLRRRRMDILMPKVLAGVDQGEDGESCAGEIKRVRGRR